MVDAEKLLESLEDDEIIGILEDLGCEKYKEHKGYISFSTSICHDGNHLNLIYFKDSKNFRCFSGCNKSYSIYNLIQKVKDISFVESLNYVSNFVNRQYQKEEIDDRDRISDWDWIKRLKKKNRNIIYTNKPLDIKVLNQFISIPHMKWLNDGILYSTQKEWNIMYDIRSNRIIYPLFGENNELCGIKGRAVDDEVEPKYLYLFPCEKSNILTGLNKTLPNILLEKKCIVFESIKSCMLAWQYGYKFSVSLEGSDISDWQLQKLLRFESEIIISLDKNIEKGKENKDFYNKIIKKIKPYSKLSLIYDKENLLVGEKSSAVDEGVEKFKLLYEGRYKIN